MAHYHHATYTPTEEEMREAWIYMQYAESVAGVEIGKVQAANFFAARDTLAAAHTTDLREQSKFYAVKAMNSDDGRDE